MFRFLKENYTKFILGGIAIFLIKYIITISLTEFTEIKPYLSYGIAMIVTLVLLFDYNALVTFHIGKSPKKKIFIKFLGTYILFYAVNWYLVYILVQKISYLIVIPLVTLFLSNALYVIYKKFIFIEEIPI
jgi:putative flippase GtrA